MTSTYEMKLSKNHTMPIDGFKENGTNSNLLVIGSSGTGKTMNVVLPMLLDSFDREPVTFVVQDCKGMLYKKLAKKFELEGYNVRLLDFVNPSKSHTFNPLCYVETLDDARKIISPIVLQQVKSQKDAFWEVAAIDLLSSLVMFIKDNFIDAYSSLHMLNKCLNYFAKDFNRVKLTKNDNDLIDINLDRMHRPNVKKEDLDKPKVVYYWKIKNLLKKSNATYLENLDTYFSYPENTFNSIVAVAKAALSVYCGNDIKQVVFGVDQMNLKYLGNSRTVIFVNPSDTSRIYDPIVSSFYSLCFENVIKVADNSKKGRLKYPFRAIIDDFASGTKILDFDKIISNIRSRNMSCTLLIQSISQLESIYSKPEANTIIANCSTHLYLGSNDFEQELNIARRLNVSYEKIHELDRNKLVIISENKKPIIDDKYDYKEHPNYSLYYQCNKNNSKKYEQNILKNIEDRKALSL